MTEDIIGRKFNKLLVLSWAEPKLRRDGSRVKRVNCLCDCGNTKAVIPSSLRSGDIKSCGCYRAPAKTRMDLTGQKIGTLTIIEEDRSRPRKLGGHRYWICRCDACGKVKSMSQSHLSGNHLARSCGCVRKKTIYPLPDMTGNRYGLLTVTGMAERQTKGSRHAGPCCECVCDCGNKVKVRARDLLSGNTRSCGCLKHKVLPGKRYGKLTLLSMGPRIHGMRYWNCRCDCGRELTVSVDTLFRASSVCCECRDISKPRTDLTGKLFGRLTVLMEVDPVKENDGTRRRCWLCRCSCGRETVVREHHLVYQITRSCGCLKKERAGSKRRSGGQGFYVF